MSFIYFFDLVSSAAMSLMQNESELVRKKNSCESFRTNYGYVMVGKYKFLSMSRGMWKEIKQTKKASLACNSI